MKVIELQQSQPTLEDVIGQAKEGLVVLRQPDGAVFAVTQVDEFALETELLKKNPEFMAFLKERSQEKAVISLAELRKELAI